MMQSNKDEAKFFRFDLTKIAKLGPLLEYIGDRQKSSEDSEYLAKVLREIQPLLQYLSENASGADIISIRTFPHDHEKGESRLIVGPNVHPRLMERSESPEARLMGRSESPEACPQDCLVKDDQGRLCCCC
jgi:hypothetical protein